MAVELYNQKKTPEHFRPRRQKPYKISTWNGMIASGNLKIWRLEPRQVKRRLRSPLTLSRKIGMPVSFGWEVPFSKSICVEVVLMNVPSTMNRQRQRWQSSFLMERIMTPASPSYLHPAFLWSLRTWWSVRAFFSIVHTNRIVRSSPGWFLVASIYLSGVARNKRKAGDISVRVW